MRGGVWPCARRRCADSCAALAFGPLVELVEPGGNGGVTCRNGNGAPPLPISGSARERRGPSNGSRAGSRAQVSSNVWRRIPAPCCRSCRRCRSLALTRLVRDAAGLTADDPAILWRYAGTLSMRLSSCRTRPSAELHGAGRHRADTEARRAQECPLAEAQPSRGDRLWLTTGIRTATSLSYALCHDCRAGGQPIRSEWKYESHRQLARHEPSVRHLT